MRIILEVDGKEYEVLEVEPGTLRTTDSTGEPVVLFPKPGERDMTTLRGVIEEALHDETHGIEGRRVCDAPGYVTADDGERLEVARCEREWLHEGPHTRHADDGSIWEWPGRTPQEQAEGVTYDATSRGEVSA